MDTDTMTTTDAQQISATVLDYVEGWFDGDADRMRRALHPELVKRCRGSREPIPTRWRRSPPRT